MAVQLEIEPLMPGDHLTREEFLRRWDARPDIKKAELVWGIVYMPSPLSADHGTRDSNVNYWLTHYALHTPGCEAGQNATWFLLADAPQPDCHLRILRECGGNSWIEKNFFHGAPELIAEVCFSSSSYDLHQKKDLFAAAGVKEYVALLLREREVRWHRLVGVQYQALLIAPDGIMRSILFPGLWLEPQALMAGNLRRVLDVLNCGLQSADHAEFARRLTRT